MNIQILEQGTYPQDKPSKGITDVNWWDPDNESWYCIDAVSLDDGDPWIAISEPPVIKKPLEDHTEAELIEKYNEKWPMRQKFMSVQLDREDLKEALIRNLK